MIWVFYVVTALYAGSVVLGLIVSWLIQQYGTFGSEHRHTTMKSPQNPQ